MHANKINEINFHLTESANEASNLADHVAQMRATVRSTLETITIRLERDIADLTDMENTLRRWEDATRAVAEPEFVPTAPMPQD